MDFAYLGRSQILGASSGGDQTMSLAPNLTRERVSFDAPLVSPLRFREAISALHDVVINDLRFKPRDKTAYEAWQKERAAERRSMYQQELASARRQLAEKRNIDPPAPGFDALFERTRRRYWDARNRLTAILRKEDVELWRWLMPCDPVITVAKDALLFECFSADESSYGCLTVSRDAFGHDSNVSLGTTNVDYSWDLFNHFQSLRSYRQTRFLIDPAGFEVKTEDAPGYREEKIDLPAGWLRGFMTTQEAMGMPGTTVRLSRDAVYSLLAFLKRHRARTSPRAARFELLPGAAPSIVLEPWEQRVVSHATRYDGPATEPIRIWGIRRLLVLARLLPLADSVDVRLLGTGLPSFWVVHMGDMHLTLGLSGWTTNDWTRGSALDLLAPPATITEDLTLGVARKLQERRAMTLAQVCAEAAVTEAAALAALRRLAFAGQVIHDLPNGLYRFRQVMPMPLGAAQLGPENPELEAARRLTLTSGAALLSSTSTGDGTLHAGKVEATPVEILVDRDGRIRRGKCLCGHFRKYGIRNGPCRHMIALRYLSSSARSAAASSNH